MRFASQTAASGFRLQVLLAVHYGCRGLGRHWVEERGYAVQTYLRQRSTRLVPKPLMPVA